MKTYNVTKEDILKFHSWGNKEDAKELEDRFTDAFEVELIVGEWYKWKYQYLIFNITKIKGVYAHYYGIDQGKWDVDSIHLNNDFVKATDLEVENALIEEAKKRGFLDCYYYTITNGDQIIEKIKRNTFGFDKHENKLLFNNFSIFQDGVWATVIPTMTKKEAEEKLNCKII